MQKEAMEKPKYAIVAAVQLQNVSDVEFEASLAERVAPIVVKVPSSYRDISDAHISKYVIRLERVV